MMMKCGLEFFYFEIEQAPSELLLPSVSRVGPKRPERLNWPGQLATSLKVLVQFQNK